MTYKLLDDPLLPIVETALWDPFVEAEVPNTQSALREAGIQCVEFVFCPRHNINVLTRQRYDKKTSWATRGSANACISSIQSDITLLPQI